MNITLSAEEELIAKSRQYAKEHNTTLNRLIRDFLEKTSGAQESTANAEEFAELAKNMAGKSRKGFRLNREDIHDRNIQP